MARAEVLERDRRVAEVVAAAGGSSTLEDLAAAVGCSRAEALLSLYRLGYREEALARLTRRR